jgi:hypothetical protein
MRIAFLLMALLTLSVPARVHAQTGCDRIRPPHQVVFVYSRPSLSEGYHIGNLYLNEAVKVSGCDIFRNGRAWCRVLWPERGFIVKYRYWIPTVQHTGSGACR